jgi:hypothetical protein
MPQVYTSFSPVARVAVARSGVAIEQHPALTGNLPRSFPSLDFSPYEKYIASCLAAAGSLLPAAQRIWRQSFLWTLRPTTFSWSEVVVLASAPP